MTSMTWDDTASADDWLRACRRAARDLEAMLAEVPTGPQRVRETGTRGEGGDRTLVIDSAAEDAVFHHLKLLYDEGARFTAVSEERGTVDFGSPDVRVVIDPIDGSLNAKRGLPHHALSIAVADGETMADVGFGFVHDFGPREEWVATRGGGVELNGRPLGAVPAERRDGEGRLEVVAIESADPRWVAMAGEQLNEVAYRLRALGAIAVSLCQVAAGRVDGMVSLMACRSVDAAAAQLIVRESGGFVSFPACETPLGAPLDLAPHSPVIAARSPQALERLARVPLVGVAR